MKKKSKSKKSKLKFNPSITGYEQIKKHIDSLIGQDVVLHVRDFSIPRNSIRTSLVNLFNNKAKRIPIYGILAEKINYFALFYFNPLNQWKYEKLHKEQEKELFKLTPSEYNEEMAITENELEFMNNEPTMEILFMMSDVNYIEDNQLYFYYNYTPRPNPIGTSLKF